MALTVDQINGIISSLETRLASGTSRERFQDQEVYWSTTDELISRINYYKDMLADVEAGTGAGTGTTRFIRMSTNSGY